MRYEFQIRAAKGMALAGREIRERHLICAADFSIHLMHLAGKSVRWKPFDHRVGIEKRPVDSLRRRAENAVMSNGVGGHDLLSVQQTGKLFPVDDDDIEHRIQQILWAGDEDVERDDVDNDRAEHEQSEVAVARDGDEDAADGLRTASQNRAIYCSGLMGFSRLFEPNCSARQSRGMPVTPVGAGSPILSIRTCRLVCHCSPWAAEPRWVCPIAFRGRIYWFVTQNARAGTTDPPGGHKHAVLTAFTGWHPMFRAVFEATDESAILKNDIIDRPPIRIRGVGRPTLLRDAAHSTTPNLGQGACQALEDVVVLADCLRQAD